MVWPALGRFMKPVHLIWAGDHNQKLTRKQCVGFLWVSILKVQPNKWLFLFRKEVEIEFKDREN